MTPDLPDFSGLGAPSADFDRLVAAIEAVLKLAEPSDEVHRDLDGNEEKGLIRVVRCDVLREAITRELTKGETTP